MAASAAAPVQHAQMPQTELRTLVQHEIAEPHVHAQSEAQPVQSEQPKFVLPKGKPLSEIRAPIGPRPVEPAAQATQSAPQPMDRDLFIPEAPSDGSSAAETPRLVNPFAAADMVNAQRAPERTAAPRKPEVSLFERITGVRRADKRHAEPAAEPVRSEPRIVSQAPAPMPTQSSVQAPVAVQPAQPVQHAMFESAPAAAPQAPQAASPLLGGLDPDERLPISGESDDPLDIPAFLRRQAN
jgi:hypothetical protein